MIGNATRRHGCAARQVQEAKTHVSVGVTLVRLDGPRLDDAKKCCATARGASGPEWWLGGGEVVWYYRDVVGC